MVIEERARLESLIKREVRSEVASVLRHLSHHITSTLESRDIKSPEDAAYAVENAIYSFANDYDRSLP